jgi:hypothetical protein
MHSYNVVETWNFKREMHGSVNFILISGNIKIQSLMPKMPDLSNRRTKIFMFMATF